MPGVTTSTGDCSEACPGYPDDKCGGSGLYGYIALDLNPSGTEGASSSAAASTSSAEVRFRISPTSCLLVGCHALSDCDDETHSLAVFMSADALGFFFPLPFLASCWFLTLFLIAGDGHCNCHRVGCAGHGDRVAGSADHLFLINSRSDVFFVFLVFLVDLCMLPDPTSRPLASPSSLTLTPRPHPPPRRPHPPPPPHRHRHPRRPPRPRHRPPRPPPRPTPPAPRR